MNLFIAKICYQLSTLTLYFKYSKEYDDENKREKKWWDEREKYFFSYEVYKIGSQPTPPYIYI